MIDQALGEFKDGLINFEDFLSWIYSSRPSTEKQLVRRAMGMVEEGATAAGTKDQAGGVALAPPTLTRESSRVLVAKAQTALEQLREQDLLDLVQSTSPEVQGLLEVLSLLLADLVPGAPRGPMLVGAKELMLRPGYFLNTCRTMPELIDECKMPEQNMESARLVRHSLGGPTP